MGRILKAVYPHIYTQKNGEKVYFTCGIPQVVMNHIEKKYIQNCDSFNSHNFLENVKNDSSVAWDPSYNLSNFHYYFINNFGEENVISVNDIDVNDKDSVYIFPLEIATTMNSLNSTFKVDLDGNYIEYTLADILAPIIDHLRADRIKIVVCIIQDPCHYAPGIRETELILRELGVNESNLVYIFGNKFVNHPIDFPDSKTNFTYGNIALQQQAKGMQYFPKMTSMGYESDIVRESDLNISEIRSKKFLCFNRSMRSHRYYIAYVAMKNNLFDNSIFSFVNVPDHDNEEHIRNSINAILEEPITDKDFSKLMNIFPLEIDTTHLNADQKRGFVTDNNKKEWYNSSYFHITSESNVYASLDDGPFFSEKTFRPIINLQPFIFVGDYGSLRELRNLGFKTFAPYIDESYDLEPDHNKRLRMIAEEIEKLNSLSLKQIHKLYYSMTDILIYNRDHFSSFKDTNPFKISYEFIQQL